MMIFVFKMMMFLQTSRFAYQYWLSVAHILGRSSTSDFGKGLGDWMTRAFAVRNVALKIMDFALELMNYVPKRMDFFTKMILFCRGLRRNLSGMRPI